MDEEDRRAEERLEAFWRDRASPRERVVWDAASQSERQVILPRLKAVLKVEDGAKAPAVAEEAGLKRAAFYNLLASWREHGLSGLVPHGTRRGRSIELADGPVRERARALLRVARPGDRNVELAASLLESTALGGDELPTARNDLLTLLQKAERVIQHERRDLATDQEFLTGAYGDGLVIDFTAVNIAIDGAPPTLAAVAIVMETASTVILGTDLGMVADGVRVQVEAIGRAVVFLADRRADRGGRGRRRCDLAVTLPPGIGADAVEASLVTDAVRDFEIGGARGPIYGQRAVQLVGPRIGRMPLFPRRTLSPELDDHARRRIMPVLDVEAARALWAREVARHNEAPLQALKAGGLLDGRGAREGRMARALVAAAGALRAADRQPG